MTPVMLLSGFLNNTPVVAMFIPVVSDWCRALRLSPSKFMIPLSYATIIGGTLTLIGTSTNLVVNGLLISQMHHPGLRMFDILAIGLPSAIVGFLYLLVAAPRLLPDRRPAIADVADPREYTVEMLVPQGSPLAGTRIGEAGLRHLPGLYLVEIDRAGHVLAAVGPREVLMEGDRLIFAGAVDSIVDLRRVRGLVPATDQVFKLDAPRNERCLVEAVVSNTCPLVGRSIRDGQFRKQYSAVVLAVARNGERLRGKIGDIVLRAGDTLLLEARPSFIERQRSSRDFFLVSGIPDSEPLQHERAPVALAILLGMVALATANWLSMLQAAMLAAGLMVATGCCAVERARRSVEWPVLIVIAAALAIGGALETTGAAACLAHGAMHFAGGSPWLTLALVYGVTMLFTEFITNNAAAALMFPIAMAGARNLGVDFMPFAIAVMMAASASFATPVGYQTNLMVYGPGGYRFGDFLRIGIPLNLLFWVLSSLVIPLAYPF
jgi:di/tricarboxylate transporter